MATTSPQAITIEKSVDVNFMTEKLGLSLTSVGGLLCSEGMNVGGTGGPFICRKIMVGFADPNGLVSWQKARSL